MDLLKMDWVRLVDLADGVVQEFGMQLAEQEIRDALAEEDIKRTDEELRRMAQMAVGSYNNDNIRAMCWEKAIEDVVEEERELELEAGNVQN
jgi:hypothetical protein